MNLMVYDSRYESTPVDWAKTCPTGHNSARGSFGENIYWSFTWEEPSLVSFPINEAVDAWFNEIEFMNPKLVSN